MLSPKKLDVNVDEVEGHVKLKKRKAQKYGTRIRCNTCAVDMGSLSL